MQESFSSWIRHHAPNRLDKAAERTRQTAFRASEDPKVSDAAKKSIVKKALLVKAAANYKKDGALGKAERTVHQAATGQAPNPLENPGYSPRGDRYAQAASSLEEDAPTNNVGSGNIAGMGVGPAGEPGLSKTLQRKRQREGAKSSNKQSNDVAVFLRRATPKLEEGTFAGKKTFKVPTSTIVNARMSKRKHRHWSKFLPEDNIGYAIREWANTNPDLPVILEDDMGNIVFVRYGKT